MRKPSMRKWLLLQFVFIIILPSTIIFFLANSLYLRSSMDQQVRSRLLLLEEYARNIDTKMRYIKQMTLQFYLNRGAMAEIQDSTPIVECGQIRSQLDSYVNSNPLIAHAYLYTAKGTIFSGHGITGMDRIDGRIQGTLASLEGRIHWHFEGAVKSLFAMEQFGIFGSRHIRKDSKPIATLHVGLREAFFFDDFSSDTYSDNGQPLFVCTDDGTVIASTEPTMTPGTRLFPEAEFREMLAGSRPYRYDADGTREERLVLNVALAAPEWVVITFLSPQEISQGIRGVRNIYYLAIFLFAGFLLSLSFVMTRRFSSPLTELSKKLSSIDAETGKVEVDPTQTPEIQRLCESFNTMTERIQELMQDAKRREKEKRRVSLQTLQLQLTPHFLYNSLNTIGWLAEINGQDNIRGITRALVSFLKEVSAVDSGFVQMGKELTLLEDYAVIQRYRYRDFELTIDVAEDLRSLYVHKMMLVNLMENSIVHGFRDREEKNRISVRAERKGKRLTIVFADNGGGFDPEELKGKPRSPNASIGLRNTRKRIRLYHGRGYGVRIQSGVGAGCTVTISIPVLTAPCE